MFYQSAKDKKKIFQQQLEIKRDSTSSTKVKYYIEIEFDKICQLVEAGIKKLDPHFWTFNNKHIFLFMELSLLYVFMFQILKNIKEKGPFDN